MSWILALLLALVPLVPGPTPAPAATAPAFAVLRPSDVPGTVLLGRATPYQPAGPETLQPVRIQPYVRVALAPGAQIRVTAPIHPGWLPDWIRGVQVTPQRFEQLARAARQRYPAMPDRAWMFHFWLDGQGRIVRLEHIFSP